LLNKKIEKNPCTKGNRDKRIYNEYGKTNCLQRTVNFDNYITGIDGKQIVSLVMDTCEKLNADWHGPFIKSEIMRCCGI